MEGNYTKWLNRINSKQDVLTEDNVGSFMDLELPTKLTPTSGDTVLGRDSLTGKAVEIPTSSLGGGGSGLALGETSSTAYRGDRGKIAYDHSQTTGNPYGTTKTDIGLGNVLNIDATNPTNIVQTSSYRFVTDSEKANLSTAYTHSQATGNPHNTKLEELNDVSGTDTTIIDDDVILKKETGGLWKKLSWSNIIATLKTYFDGMYAPKAFNIKVTTPSSYVTGTTSETEVLRIEIPPNTLSANDILTISTIMVDKIGTSGNLNLFGKLSTSPTMPSGTTDLIFKYTLSAANQFGEVYRDFIINGGEIKGFPFTVSGATSTGGTNASKFTSKPIDVSVTNYLYISLQGSASEQFRLLGLKISNQ